MAAAVITCSRTRARRPLVDATRAWLLAYSAVCGVTLTAAAAVALAGGALAASTRGMLGLALTPTPADPWHVLTLAAHNTPIAAWPLLLGLAGAARHARARRCRDLAVLACMAANVLPVGAALGAYGSALIPYIPQLPLEWAALAAGYASWIVQRKRALTGRERLLWLAAIATLVSVAATLETVAVPHR